ncbi:ribosome biogenesis GTP-binding protein YihA/YsxC [Halodesulfovibrio marinisediminis]|uniref:Probable GTP-binding protein EngB n=1 Tax=Halodesulfovibrio marinisediminis DSM 17456 TaxID=1121457 RepID=A0A1N6E6H0_9BACT|nr:ribosome biogenesis GTP-binding protein YihA/YsxC [Halodesulfovibrio marinisediminis]SIN78622.1 GTP-binding protein [Halodesulfovibrio marinisediminis DSM 17456]
MQPNLILEDTIYTLEQLQEVDVPQIALAGRSNVGKSSLINALAGRKNLARTSSTPGKTQSINFYRVEPWQYYLVDLPGYGYAKVSKADRQKWAELINKYLISTPGLKALAVLIDSRVPPQQIDIELTSYARQIDLPLIPILTKGDKCKQSERVAKQNEWAKLLGGIKPIISSASTGLGVDKIWHAFSEHAMDPEEFARIDEEVKKAKAEKKAQRAARAEKRENAKPKAKSKKATPSKKKKKKK